MPSASLASVGCRGALPGGHTGEPVALGPEVVAVVGEAVTELAVLGEQVALVGGPVPGGGRVVALLAGLTGDVRAVRSASASLGSATAAPASAGACSSSAGAWSSSVAVRLASESVSPARASASSARSGAGSASDARRGSVEA